MALRDKIAALRCVQAGWAFGVPEDGRARWLDDVTGVCDHGAMFPELFEALDATMAGVRLLLAGNPTPQESERAIARIQDAQTALYRSQGVGQDPHEHTRPPTGGPPV
jgi:hypothetical protein